MGPAMVVPTRSPTAPDETDLGPNPAQDALALPGAPRAPLPRASPDACHLAQRRPRLGYQQGAGERTCDMRHEPSHVDAVGLK